MITNWFAFADDWENNHKVVFDGANRWIIVYPSVATLDIKTDVYSAWKEWVQLRDNAKYLAAIRTIGGDPTLAGQKAGDIYFLINGWKLIIDFTATAVTGILYSDDFDTAYYDEQLDPLYPAVVSSTVNTVTTGGSVATSDQLQALVGQMVAAIWGTENATQILEMWKLMGLDPVNPLTTTRTSRVVDDIAIQLTGDGENTSTAQRL